MRFAPSDSLILIKYADSESPNTSQAAPLGAVPTSKVCLLICISGEDKTRGPPLP